MDRSSATDYAALVPTKRAGFLLVHSQKNGFNGSSEWTMVPPGTFCYLNQANESPNYTQLYRTIKGSSFPCGEP